jgi:hypothetical protein
MSVFEEHRERLEDYETMLGRQRGRLALTLDLVTDAIALAGQHGVYCRRAREGEPPAPDLAAILRSLDQAKELIRSVMDDLRARDGRAGA